MAKRGRPVGWRKYPDETDEEKRARRMAALDKRVALVTGAKHRAKRDGMEHSITVATLKWPSHCPVLGLELDYSYRGGMARRGNSPSLDRWNNDVGYTLHNTVVISDRANRLKKDGTLDELMRVAYYAKYGRMMPPPGLEDVWGD